MSEQAVAKPPEVISIEYRRHRFTVKFFTQTHGASVYIGLDGKFYVAFAGVWHCKPSLAKIEREIINFAKGVGVKIFYLDEQEKVQVEEIIGTQGNRVVFRSGKTTYKHQTTMFRFDEKLMKKCADYWKRKAESEAAFEKEWNKLSEDVDPVSVYSIDRLLAVEALKIKES